MESRFRNAIAIFKCKTLQRITASPKIELHFLGHLEAGEATIFNYKCILTHILQFLVEDLCHSTERGGNTPLHIASECGNLGAVKFLLDHGASANAQNHEREIPMHLAAGKGIEQYVRD